MQVTDNAVYIARPWTEAVVSTLTSLLGFASLSNYSALLLVMVNVDPTVPVTFVVDTSEDGEHPEPERTYTLEAGPGEQVSVEVGVPNLRRYWRIAAHTKSPDFPDAMVKWCVLGTAR